MVTWPTSKETSLAEPTSDASQASDWARKDANEVLMKDGAAVLKAYVDAAKPLPIRGLFRFNDFWEQVRGVGAGWRGSAADAAPCACATQNGAHSALAPTRTHTPAD